MICYRDVAELSHKEQLQLKAWNNQYLGKLQARHKRAKKLAEIINRIELEGEKDGTE